MGRILTVLLFALPVVVERGGCGGQEKPVDRCACTERSVFEQCVAEGGRIEPERPDCEVKACCY